MSKLNFKQTAAIVAEVLSGRSGASRVNVFSGSEHHAYCHSNNGEYTPQEAGDFLSQDFSDDCREFEIQTSL